MYMNAWATQTYTNARTHAGKCARIFTYIFYCKAIVKIDFEIRIISEVCF